MNHVAATIKTNRDSVNLAMNIPKSILTQKRIKNFLFDAIMISEGISYQTDIVKSEKNYNITEVGVNTNKNKTQIKKYKNINNDYLGDHVTKEQFSDIANGSFISLPIGSYWTINNINYRIMALDQFYGYNGINKHHVVIMPDTIIYNLESYNRFNRNRGGYCSSELKSRIENTYNTIIEFIFGSNHVLYHTHDLTSGNYNDGKLIPVVGTKAWLINSYNVNGIKYSCETEYDWQDADKVQFPAFKKDNSLKKSTYNGHDYGWWLGSSLSGNSCNFCLVNPSGTVSYNYASSSRGVRPAFLVY